MSKRLQLRKGTTAQQATFTGAVGEPTYDTEKKTIVMHDGVKAGGIVLAKELDNLAVTKADFFAQAEKRIRDNAGSGFAEWGNGYLSAQVKYEVVNDGLWFDTSNSNTVRLGRLDSLGVGVSRTPYALTQVNGVKHTLKYLNTTNAAVDMKFPPAPNGRKTYDSATGSVVEHASAAEAFEGLVTNGDFRNGTTGWSAGDAGAIISETGGILKVTNSDNTTALASQTLSVTVGVSYTLSVSSGGGTAGAKVFVGTTPNGVEDLAPQYFTDNATFTFTASSSTVYLSLSIGNSFTNSYQEYNSCSVMPATESVITSRQDFTFLESFHEKISDKDVVYPLGNVQYGASSWEGVTLSNTVVAQGYSAFGEWDTSTKGYGVVWSTLSDANKAKFLQDPENNIYNDDGDLVQVRYRVRVVEGLGDSWKMLEANSTTTTPISYDHLSNVLATGQLTTPVDFSSNSTGQFRSAYGTLTTVVGAAGNKGLWALRETGAVGNFAHNGLCFAVPIALVSRRNSGAYHPAFNSEGCSSFGADGSDFATYPWYSSLAKKPTSTLEAFSKATLNSNGGKIVGTSGRPDSKYYDAIYASDVQDLRMSSKRLPLTEIREKYKRMGIAGDVRGFESVPFTKVIGGYTSTLDIQVRLDASGLLNVYIAPSIEGSNAWYSPTSYVVGDSYNFAFYASGTLYAVSGKYSGYSAPNGLAFINTEDTLNTYSRSSAWNEIGTTTVALLVSYAQTHKQSSPTWTDIIGSPANIAATFPQGVEGQWIPVIPLTGTTVTANLNRKSLTATIARESTGDAGATWGNNAVTINTTTNSWSAAFGTSGVYVIHYSTQSHFTEDDVNSKVLDLGDVIIQGGYYAPYWGAGLSNSLLSKVATSLVGGSGHSETTMKHVTIRGDTGKLNTSSGSIDNNINNTISKPNPNGDSSGIKTLDYLSSENSVAKLMYAYKEMVWDSGADQPTDAVTTLYDTSYAFVAGTLYRITGGGTSDTIALCTTSVTAPFNAMYLVGDEFYSNSTGLKYFDSWDGNGFGDNNQFEITNNQATQTDDNGNTVLYGTASFNTQYFITEE